MSAPGNHPPAILRPIQRPEDDDYVLPTWTRSYAGKLCAADVSENPQWKLAKGLLECCACLVAAFDEDQSYILGWAVTSTDCVHYVYVRPEYRRMGLATKLLDPFLRRRGIIYTHTPNRAWWPPPNHGTARDPDAVSRRLRHGMVPECKRCRDEKAACSRHFIPRVPDGWRYNPYHAFELASQTQAYRDLAYMKAFTKSGT